jgi:hypothetical protein
LSASVKSCPIQGNEFVQECQVTVTGYAIVGNFHAMIPFAGNHELEGAGNELDRIEQHASSVYLVFKIIPTWKNTPQDKLGNRTQKQTDGGHVVTALPILPILRDHPINTFPVAIPKTRFWSGALDYLRISLEIFRPRWSLPDWYFVSKRILHTL